VLVTKSYDPGFKILIKIGVILNIVKDLLFNASDCKYASGFMTNPKATVRLPGSHP